MNAAQLKDKLLSYVTAEVQQRYQRDKMYFGYHVRLVVGVQQTPHLQMEDYEVQLTQQRIEPAQYMRPLNEALPNIAPGHIQLEWLMVCSPSVQICYEPESQYLWEVCRWLLQQCEMKNEACGATRRRVDMVAQEAKRRAQEDAERRADEAMATRLQAIQAAREANRQRAIKKKAADAARWEETKARRRETLAKQQHRALRCMEDLNSSLADSCGRSMARDAKLDTLQELLECSLEQAAQILDQHEHRFYPARGVQICRRCCPHAERSITPKWRAPRYTLDRYDGQPDCMD